MARRRRRLPKVISPRLGVVVQFPSDRVVARRVSSMAPASVIVLPIIRIERNPDVPADADQKVTT